MIVNKVADPHKTNVDINMKYVDVSQYRILPPARCHDRILRTVYNLTNLLISSISFIIVYLQSMRLGLD